MAVRIRMKKMGRKHRPFYRICAIDQRAPRGGKVLEELGTYDPMVRETDARALLNGERVAYWIGVGAQPSDKVAILIKKYGLNGTHTEAQQSALARLAQRPEVKLPPMPKIEPKPAAAPEAAEPAAEEAAATE